MSAYRTALLVWLALLGLIATSVSAAVWMSGPAGHGLSFACALAMAALIFSVYMRLNEADGLLRVFALGGFVWLGFMLSITALDFISR